MPLKGNFLCERSRKFEKRAYPVGSRAVDRLVGQRGEPMPGAGLLKPYSGRQSKPGGLATHLMKTNLKLHLEIDRDLLAPTNQGAGIPDISPERYIESYLVALLNDLAGDPVLHIANELFYQSYPSRELAEEAAEAFEADAISEKLNGDSAPSTVTTEVVQYRRGSWRVKVHLLTKTGWKLIAWDLWDEEDRADFRKKGASK